MWSLDELSDSVNIGDMFLTESEDEGSSSSFEMMLQDGWRRRAAALKARSEVLRMDKKLSQQRWEDGCGDRAEASRRAYALRLAVEAALEDGYVVEEVVAKQVRAKETVREILAQIDAEAEQWKHAQGVLRSVSAEMAAVQAACLRWEKRALDAEALAAARLRQGEEWRVKAQRAQQKIENVEAELQGLRQRHALEQSRNSGPSSNLLHGFTVKILQPNAISETGRRSNVVKEGCQCSAEFIQALQAGKELPRNHVSIPERGRGRSASVDTVSSRSAPVRKASPNSRGVSEVKENLCVSVSNSATKSKVFRGRSPARKPAQSPSLLSSRSSVNQRAPLKDMKTNIPVMR